MKLLSRIFRAIVWSVVFVPLAVVLASVFALADWLVDHEYRTVDLVTSLNEKTVNFKPEDLKTVFKNN
jgi:hypothetical protein